MGVARGALYVPVNMDNCNHEVVRLFLGGAQLERRLHDKNTNFTNIIH
jgi:hypothetical protein